MKNTNVYLSLCSLSFLALLFFNSCKKEEATQSQSASDISNAKAKIIVHAGESIQAAVDAAKPGALIQIEPGTYSESITVNKAGIKLVGLTVNGAGVVIQNPGDEEDGIVVNDAGDGFTLQNVTVKNFEENGVVLDSVDNFKISYVTAIDNGEYGIFPVHSSQGLIDHCIVSGHSDTGIYVGQSDDVRMQFNTAYGNVNGLEIENSSNVTAAYNNSYDNVAGILIDVLPGKDIKTCSNISVKFNRLYNNNHINFGDTAGLESSIPTGIGILVLGADQTLIADNVVTNNDFTGIVVFSTLVLSVIAGVPPEVILADIEPNPDGNVITRNLLRNNGSNPPVIPGLPLPGVDLLWDSSGINNCWSNNVYTTSAPSPLPSCN